MQSRPWHPSFRSSRASTCMLYITPLWLLRLQTLPTWAECLHQMQKQFRMLLVWHIIDGKGLCPRAPCAPKTTLPSYQKCHNLRVALLLAARASNQMTTRHIKGLTHNVYPQAETIKRETTEGANYNSTNKRSLYSSIECNFGQTR